MGKRRGKKRRLEEPRPRRRRLGVLAGVVVLAALAGLGFWAWGTGSAPTGGTPRLALDQTDVNIGYRRFDTSARVVFTLTNTGDAPLRITEAPRVQVKAGC
jgi:hypothetical protein